jgi:Domain of unknown function (DUF4340)
MIVKKPTLIILGLAIVLAGAVYYFDWKGSSAPKVTPPKRAYSIQASDVVSLTLAHPNQPGEPAIHFAKRGGSWQIVQPVDTAADESTVDGLVDQLASADVSQTEPGAPDRLKAYGLDPPQASLDFQLANGSTHTLLIGNKSFDGDSVYAIVDGAHQVSLLPELLGTSTAKNLDALRDRSVLHFDSAVTASFTIKRPSGEIEASKENQQWKLKKPSNAFASQDAVDSLLQAVSGATMLSVASEKPDNLAHYGLANPAISFTVTDGKGAQSALLIGKKDGDSYFARDVSRPTIFRVSDDLYKKLSENFSDLRDKKVVHVDSSDIQAIEVRDSNGLLSISRKKDSPDDWIFNAPPDQTGKAASSWKIIDPLTSLTAEDVIDHPAPNLLALEAHPEVTAVLTAQDGKTVTVKISKALGDFAYAQASGSPSLYKIKKDSLDALNVKPADVAQ